MKRLTPVILFFITALIILPKTAVADLINPDYYTARCRSGEVMFECKYRSSTPFGPATYDECSKYRNNPSYRYLDGEGHSFGGKSAYCFKQVSSKELISYHIQTLLPLIFITLLLEIPIFYLFISRAKKSLLAVATVNLISVTIVYFVTTVLPFSNYWILLIIELAVIIFEALTIKIILKEPGLRKLIIYSFFANTVSALLGTVLLKFADIFRNLE